MNPDFSATAIIVVSLIAGLGCLLFGAGDQATMWFVAVMLMNFLNVRLP